MRIVCINNRCFPAPSVATNYRRYSGKIGLLLAMSLLLSGCWGSSSEPEPEPEAKELKADKDPLSTEVPEAELVKLSKQLYQVGMYTVARDSLASLKDRYPLGAYANFAELKHADSFFFNREYNEAAKAYENIIKNYPGSSDLPYVKLQAARSHIASARDAGRDRQPWERGLVIYDEIVNQYSGSAYSDLARSERAKVILELTAYDREIIEFYRNQGNQAAVDGREKQFTARWGERLAGAIDSKAVGDGQPQGTSLKDLQLAALRVEQIPPVSSLELASPKGSEATETSTGAAQSPLIEGRIVIQSLRCNNDSVPFATIEVTRIPSSLDASGASLILTPTAGVITIANLNLTAKQTSWDCFASQDLSLTPEGELLIKTERSLSINTLLDPPRILISLGN